MPKVGLKVFPYNKAGKRAATIYAKKTGLIKIDESPADQKKDKKMGIKEGSRKDNKLDKGKKK